MVQTVKCLPTMWETRVQFLGWEDLLEKVVIEQSLKGYVKVNLMNGEMRQYEGI